MSITENELAEKLWEEAGDGYTTGTGKWRGVARKAAELLGVELAPERVEPGIYLTSDHQSIVRVSRLGDGEFLDFKTSAGGHLRPDEIRNMALTPARVVPATPVELTEDEVGDLHDSIRPRWTKSFRDSNPQVRESTLKFAHAILAKYGHATKESAR